MSNEELKKLERERDDQVTRIFWAGLEIAVLFAVPLGIAVLISLQLGGKSKWVALPIAFVFSWVLMIMRYRKLSAKMRRIDEQIKELKEELATEK